MKSLKELAEYRDWPEVRGGDGVLHFGQEYVRSFQKVGGTLSVEKRMIEDDKERVVQNVW